jgi:hypothetical protein
MKSAASSKSPSLSLLTIVYAAWPWTTLTAAEASSTIYRFFRSKHVVDLKFFAQIAALVGAIACLILLMKGVFIWHGTDHVAKPLIRTVDAFVVDAVKTLGFVGIVLAWTYRSACARLGVVDLFACEIGTLCRVGTIFDIGEKYVAQYKQGPGASLSGIEKRVARDSAFVSQEEYFPVFQNNNRDLQLLEAEVVNNITEFYTYMKAARDSLRQLAETSPSVVADPKPAADAELSSTPDAWHVALCNVIYMVFLAYESGRKAITDLVEFEPVAAERKVVILLTELQMYGFLVNFFGHDDIHYKRLKLREADYKIKVRKLYKMVKAHAQQDQWQPALSSLGDLKDRFKQALDEEIDAEVPLNGSAHSERLAGGAVAPPTLANSRDSLLPVTEPTA